MQHQIVKCDCQPSANDGIVIFITGNLLVDDNANPLKSETPKRLFGRGFLRFAQVFQLMKGPTGRGELKSKAFHLPGTTIATTTCSASTSAESTGGKLLAKNVWRHGREMSIVGSRVEDGP